MELWIGALALGLIYAFMSIGVYITYKILDFPDITVDGSFTLGAAVSAVFIANGYNPFLSLIIAFFAGGIAGSLTGIIHTKMKVNGLLAGILVMIALYSINLHIMGRSNVPLLNYPSYITYIDKFNPNLMGDLWLSIVMFVIIALFCVKIGLFFKTDLGITLRAVGDNSIMTSAQGVNVDNMKIFGISLSNALVGFAGAAIAQYQGFADIGMGIGIVVNGLASVIIGEALLKIPSIYARFSSAILGSIIFRFMIAFALFAGMNPIDLKLLTALFVLLTIYSSLLLSKKSGRKKGFKINLSKKSLTTILLLLLISLAVYFGSMLFNNIGSGNKNIEHKIGIVQVTSNGILDLTKEGLLDEFKKLGYDEKNTNFILKNANGDISTLNSIIDSYISEKVDVIVTISTPATQAALNKVKDTPIVFATVANPFILKAGTSETEHLPNVTGTYGWAPMDITTNFISELFGKKLTLGAVWDIGQTNSEFNMKNLRAELKNYPDIKLVEATVNSSSEVQQAASSLLNKGIDVLVLPPDNTVYSAFDAILKSVNQAKVPVIINDVERINDGALAAVGYDYFSSGVSAAKLVDRILKGENPKDIPFEKYSKLTFGLNLDVAQKLGKKFSDEIIYKANLFVGTKKVEKKFKIGIVQFAMEPNVEIVKEGIIKALAGYAYKDGENIEIIYKNANADFPMINSIMQDLISQNVDIIVPLSTPVVQSAVQMVGTRVTPKVVFTYIYDPYRIGAAKSAKEHLNNFSGVSCFPSVDGMLALIREMFPNKNKIGIVWNSSEANSESVLIKYREIAKKYSFEIIEKTVSNPNEVLDASKSLINSGAEIFLNSGDNTLNVAYDSYAKVAADNNIPLFSADAELIYNNTLAILGPSYERTGFDGGIYLAKVLDGANIANLPIKQTEQSVLYLNLDVAKKLNYTFSPELIKKADKLIQNNEEVKDKKISENAVNSDKNKKLAYFCFNDNPALEEIQKGVDDYFKKNEILKKYGLLTDYYNAQGDFNNSQIIAKDIIYNKYDYIVTLSTPALQSIAGQNKTIPHIFGGVIDPYSLGVATNSKIHTPNITGVATMQPVENTFRTMREIFPKAKKVGLIWNTAEASSLACTKIARNAAKKYGFELLEANASNFTEISDALNSLLNKKIDLFLTSGDNTMIAAVSYVAKILHDNKIPFFTNGSNNDVKNGTFATQGASYYDVGIELAKTIIKVLDGKPTKDIPIDDYCPDRLILSKKLIDEYKVNVPKSVLSLNKVEIQ